jgi:hypothetical protein
MENYKSKFTEAPGTAKTVEERVYNMLFSQPFADFYNGDFEDHLTGEKDAPSKKEILERIKSLLGK